MDHTETTDLHSTNESIATRHGAWRETPRFFKAALIITALATLSICLRAEPLLLWYPFIEDAYYAFSVSRNLADGNGLSVDGSTWTNGLQPLTTVLYSIPFVTGIPDVGALRVILVLQWLTLMCTGTLVGLITRTYLLGNSLQRYAFPMGFLGLVCSFYAINTSLNGLETGALLLGYAGLWHFFQVRRLDQMRYAVSFGLLGGVVALIRIDSLLVIAVLLVGVLAVYGIRVAITAGFVTLLVVLPWLLYGLILTGSPIPSSGRAQTLVELSSFRLDRILEALSAVGFPWLPISSLVPSFSTLIRFIFIGLLISIFFALRRRLPRQAIRKRSEIFALSLLVGVFLLAGYYGLTSFAFWFYGRYLSPLLLVVALILSVSLVLMGSVASRVAGGLLTLVAIVASAFHWVPGTYQENTMLTEQVALVHDTVPPTDAVAASQTGTLAFFRQNTVNLDGKVNTEILDYRGSINAYLDELSVVWICDWPRQIDALVDLEADGWEIYSQRGEYVCVTRVSER